MTIAYDTFRQKRFIEEVRRLMDIAGGADRSATSRRGRAEARA
jgi:hypothetical protein